MTFSKFHIAIEGNVGAGKTTFAKALTQELNSRGGGFSVLSEPIQRWQSFGRSQVNLLEQMYNGQAAGQDVNWSLHFQLVALLTKLEQLEQSSSRIVVERTLGAQQNVFVPLLAEKGEITEMQEDILKGLLSTTKAIHPPDIYIYMRATPDICFWRLGLRQRAEERHVRLSYLTQLHDKYEAWLGTGQVLDVPKLVIDASNTIDFNVRLVREWVTSFI